MTVIQVYHHKFTGRGCGWRSRDYYFTSKPVADPAEGARASHLFLKQTEARGAKKKCFSNRRGGGGGGGGGAKKKFL